MKTPLLLRLYLPLVPLETLRRCWSETGAYAAMESGQVLTTSPLATHAGVRAGLPTDGAAAIAPDTVLLESDPAKEAAAPEAIALALLQFPQK
ncbi:hypothetical protein [Duganella levis]|uniref:Uncharacterized protein n=1 Tax=Duganella levis TaxID=2692169 RepID=A0ABW9VT62_9BURK|nr:hypothetical protein [Duganella levis]MYN24815.1 hypothetical protein [Duganella levis]